MSPSVVLILGAGPGIGANTAAQFLARGCKVASVSRSGKISYESGGEDCLHITADLSTPSCVPGIFAEVEERLGIPSVVIYNCAMRTLLSADDPLSSIIMEEYERDININITSAIMAAKEAVAGFKRIRPTSPGLQPTFIYTGNKLNVMADPKALTFGIAKTAAAHLIWDCSVAYRNKGYKFYFVDERLSSGAPARDVMDPKARARVYVDLAEDDNQNPWHYTFVKEQGYVDFRKIDRAWSVAP